MGNEKSQLAILGVNHDADSAKKRTVAAPMLTIRFFKPRFCIEAVGSHDIVR